jgi:hypothetical protein
LHQRISLTLPFYDVIIGGLDDIVAS